MDKTLFHVSIKEPGATDYTGNYRVISMIPVTFERKLKKTYYNDVLLLVVTVDNKFRKESIDDCMFLGF